MIGVYVVETDDGPALFDCGPSTCIPALEEGLAERGLELADIRHLLLSHIHLDHAGAAGVLVREHPGLQVHVSAIGAPHVVDPSRLERARAASTATPSTSSGASSRRCRRRTSTSSDDDVARARVLPDPGPRVAPRLVPRDGRDALRGRRRGRPHRPGAGTSSPSRRRRTSTSRPGSGRSTRSSAASLRGSR